MNIPVDKEGNIVWCPQKGVSYDTIETRQFNGWMDICGHVMHGNTLKYILETHDKSKKYEVFCIDLELMMLHMDKGKVAGMFDFVKRGNQYGIQLVHAST